MATHPDPGHEEAPESAPRKPDLRLVETPEDHDVEDEQEHIEEEVLEDLGPEFCTTIEGEINPEEYETVKIKLLDRLKRAKNAESRVDIFSKIVDWCGIDALVGFVFPEVGDAGAATVELTYLLTEANLAGMEYKGQAKIAAHQLVDLAIGLIPVAGDVADLFYMANRYGAAEFEKNTEKVAAQAIAAGVPKEKVEEILASGKRLREAAAKANQIKDEEFKKAA